MVVDPLQVEQHALEHSCDLGPEQQELSQLALSELSDGEKGLLLALQVHGVSTSFTYVNRKLGSRRQPWS